MTDFDQLGAFVPGARLSIEGRPGGPLSGLRFAAKDLFDVAGHPTGAGNHDWAKRNPIPRKNAWTVQTLLDAGAMLVGKTVTDEVSLGILGENRFDGTPLNPRASQCVPGGSSSGSASAVAGNACDFALATDTGGSVRVPASFCGLWGIRPTHGAIDLTGVLAQAPSSDTAGWLAGDAAVFRKVSEVMFRQKTPNELPRRLIVAVDAFGFASAEVNAALQPMVSRLAELMEVREEVMAPPGITTWARAQRTLQRHEAWTTFKTWIDEDDPRFAFSVARNLAFASQISQEDRSWAALVRHEARARMRYLLPPGTILCMPTTPITAPRRGQALSVIDPLKDQILALCSHGGLTGVPQVSIPGATAAGRPIGLSLVGGHGSDLTLIAVATALAGQ